MDQSTSLTSLMMDGFIRLSAQHGLLLHTNAVSATKNQHWIFDDEHGKCILSYWTGTGIWYSTATGRNGVARDPGEALGIAIECMQSSMGVSEVLPSPEKELMKFPYQRQLRLVTVTKELLRRGKPKRRGWTKPQLACLGVSWPPPKRWKKKVLGKRIDEGDAEDFVWLARSHPQPSK